jgi:hypothetical protein
MKGFMFSIEALATMAVILLTLSFYYVAETPNNETQKLELQHQSDKAMMIYFNEKTSTPNADTNQQYCGKINYYNPIKKKTEEKQTCRGIK